MRNTLYTLRPAIAMIELIFAIVVMGIVMLSVPQLLSTASQSGYVAIQQEAINEASTKVNIIMGYDWDENNTQDGNRTVLFTTDGDAELNATQGPPYTRRAGTPKSSYRTFTGHGGLTLKASAIGKDLDDMNQTDDMDDFNGIGGTLLFEENAGASDYIERATVILNSTVSYISDAENDSGTYTNPGDNNLRFDLNTTAFPAGQTTNIKHIQVRLTSDSGVSELNKTIILHAFSCNIGTYKLEERS